MISAVQVGGTEVVRLADEMVELADAVDRDIEDELIGPEEFTEEERVLEMELSPLEITEDE